MRVNAIRVLAMLLSLSHAVFSAAQTGEVIEQTSERGPVTATVSVSPARPLLGDPISLTLTVVAEAGVEILMPEFAQALDRFSVTDFVPRETIDEAGRSVAVQRYTLQAPLSGEQQIPPIMIEFVDRRPGQRPTPEGEDAYELLTERLSFQVQSVLPEQAAAELKPLLGKLEPLADKPLAGGPWRLLLLALGLTALAFLLWLGWQRWHARIRQRSAYEIAYGRLQALLQRPRPDAGEMKAFFVELTAIVRHYLEDRFALHAPELTTEEFLDVAAASPDLNREQRGFLRDFLQYADQVKFARHIPAAERAEEALLSATRFIQQTAAKAQQHA